MITKKTSEYEIKFLSREKCTDPAASNATFRYIEKRV
jgi:hypothetical protein